MWDYAGGSLYSLPSVVATENLGLHEGTLYDVLDINQGVGNSTVNATGFNISCGFLTDMNVTFSPGSDSFSPGSGHWGGIQSTRKAIFINETASLMLLQNPASLLHST